MKKINELSHISLIVFLIATTTAYADNDKSSSNVVLTIPLTATTVGPPWPPSEVTDANGDFTVIGSILEIEDGNGNCFLGPPRAVVVSKETVPPLGPGGKEDFSNPFGACHDVLRELDLNEGSPDLDMVLHTSSFGPVTGDFGGGPRIPREGDNTYNLNALPPLCPELFPTADQQGYMRDAFPLHETPIWGFTGDNQRYDTETGDRIPTVELLRDQRPRSEPITLGDWIKADQRSLVKVKLTDYDPQQGAFTAAEFSFVFKDLIPNAVYTIWGTRLVTVQGLLTLQNPRPPGEEIVLPGPLFLPNVFSTDDKGKAAFRGKVENPFPSLQGPDALLRTVRISVAYHPTYQNWGACFGIYGLAVDHTVHLDTGFAAFDALETVAKQ